MFDISEEVLMIVYVGTLFRKFPNTGRTVKHTGGYRHVGPTSMRETLFEQVVEVTLDLAGIDAVQIDSVSADKDMITLAAVLFRFVNKRAIVPIVSVGKRGKRDAF